MATLLIIRAGGRDSDERDAEDKLRRQRRKNIGRWRNRGRNMGKSKTKHLHRVGEAGWGLAVSW